MLGNRFSANGLEALTSRCPRLRALLILGISVYKYAHDSATICNTSNMSHTLVQSGVSPLFFLLEKKNLHQVQLKHPRAPGALGSETAYSPVRSWISLRLLPSVLLCLPSSLRSWARKSEAQLASILSSSSWASWTTQTISERERPTNVAPPNQTPSSGFWLVCSSS